MKDTPAPKSVPQKLAQRVLDWSDERSVGNPIMVTLTYGWAYEAGDEFTACHVRGAETVREAINGIKSAVPCQCSRCQHKN